MDHHMNDMNDDNDNNNIKYDPNVIIQSANDKLSSGDLEGGQMVFQSALLEWVDDAREQSNNDEIMREAIATLWIAYAHFLASAKQFKSATEAYEQAVSCPVARSVGRVWLDYARFAEDRGRTKTAQGIYLRALIGTTGGGAGNDGAVVSDEQDQALLWSEFLELMRKANPDLTLQALQQAVESEHAPSPELTTSAAAIAAAPEAIFSSLMDRNTTPPPNKRARLTPPPTTTTSSSTTKTKTLEESKTHVVTAESVQFEAAAFTELLVTANTNETGMLPPELVAAWMIRDGHEAPLHRPEPPFFNPSPPKLADPTAKDLLGLDLALQLIQRLVTDTSGTLVLEVCQGLWALQALQEVQAKNALDHFDKAVTAESDRLEATVWEARLSVATDDASYASVQQMNQVERQNFQTNSQLQRSRVLSQIVWHFRQLHCQQQMILTKLNVPGFDGTTVDAATLELQAAICSYLHSAFYLRKRIGQAPHVAMLENQVQRLTKEQEINMGGGGGGGGQWNTSTSPVPPVLAGRLSPIATGRHSPVPAGGQGMTSPYNTNVYGGVSSGNVTPPRMMMMVPPHQQQQQYQQQYLPPPPQQPVFTYAQQQAHLLQQQQQQQQQQVQLQPQIMMPMPNYGYPQQQFVLQQQQGLQQPPMMPPPPSTNQPLLPPGGVYGGPPSQQQQPPQQQQQYPYYRG